jgi:hypothetical protein
MKVKSMIASFTAGVGSAVLFENIRNGNMQKMMKKMLKKDIKCMNDLEDMM